MVLFESINISSFVGNRCSIRYVNKTMIITSTSDHSNSLIFVQNIDPIEGNYSINVEINSQYQLHWWGTYDQYKKSTLINGRNIVNITIKDQKHPFSIGIYSDSLPYGKSFQIQTIKVIPQETRINLPIKVIHSEFRINLPIKRTNAHRMINRPTLNKPLAIEWKNNQKKILLVADVHNWCFDNICQTIKKYYGNLYVIHVVYSTENISSNNAYGEKNFDLIIKFWYDHNKVDPFTMYPNAKKAICVYDYLYWNRITGKPIKMRTLKNFIDNITKADYILYSCPAIKDLLMQQHQKILKNKELYPVFDGVDINKFYYKDYNSSKKLIVGWVGNSFNVFKRFSVLKNLLSGLNWVDFKIQDTKNLISHDKMVDFYHNIDLIVCISDAEGTPNPILEASSCGRAWVSTEVGIVRLLNDVYNEDIRPGIIIKNYIELLDKLKFLHLNRDIMRKMGQIGRKSVEKEFSWDIRIKQFHQIFKLIDDNNKDGAKITPKNENTELIKIAPKTQELTKTSKVGPVTESESISNKKKPKMVSFKPVSLANEEYSIKKSYVPKIIITSTQYPRYGGGATAAYELHKYLISNDVPSICIFFDNKIKENKTLLNPDNLPNVFGSFIMKDQNSKDISKYQTLLKDVTNIYGNEPYHIFGFNYLAPIISKKIFEKSKIYYIITGCCYINNTNLVDCSTYLRKPIMVHDMDAMEKQTVQIADVIIANSQLCKNLFEHTYHMYLRNFVDFHDIFKLKNAQPNNNDRKYDISFICSNFDRKVKNPDLIKSIFNNEKLKKYVKICIGSKSDKYIINNESNKVFTKDFSDQDKIIDVLNNSKIVLVPSYIETYGISAIEATKCGCITLLTKNAGCTATMNRYFVIDSYDEKEWIDKIETILQNYHYFKNIFYNDYEKTPTVDHLFNDYFNYCNQKINIIFSSIDIPFIGGAATNLYRLIKCFSDDKNFNVYGIFISNLVGNYNPDNLKNIHKISLNETTEENLILLRDQIIQKNGKINIVFCKNYKVLPFFKKVFKGIKIIFSPSGLRYISSIMSSNYLLDLDANIITSKKIDYKLPENNIYKCISDNDVNLDDCVMKLSDVIVPNSLLTYNTIKKFYGDRPNLNYPVYITNIITSKYHEDNFINRPIDLLFCSYSWKRQCKNYSLVVEIVNKLKSNHKIIIVGKEQSVKFSDSNVVIHEYLNNVHLLKLLRDVKVVVIPSKYDSNPNILIEAVISGCNVVTSKNVGNNENLDSNCIVNDYKNINNWISVIIKCLLKRYNYRESCDKKVFNDLKELFIRTVKSKKSVSVYKIPPELNWQTDKLLHSSFNPLDCIEEYNDQLVDSLFNYDIYFNLFIEISNREQCTDINYIIFDSSIKSNVFIYPYKFYPTCNNFVRIWKIKDLESLMYFNNADLYFMRGTYYNFFEAIIPKSAKSVYYSATSFKQSIKPDLSVTTLLGKFDVVLTHEDPRYQQVYQSNKYVMFDKFATDKFVFTNDQREYDLCFVATEKQKTKNHHLFLHLVKYLDDIKKECKIILIGSLKSILKMHKMDKFLGKLTSVTLVNKDQCDKMELVKVYNKSKINILFSGRDAYPRVISESAACGCFNIALDTLSDGKTFYDGTLGILIKENTVKKRLKSGSSLSYDPNPKLWNQIIKYMDTTFDHGAISLQFKKKYNLMNAVDSIMN